MPVQGPCINQTRSLQMPLCQPMAGHLRRVLTRSQRYQTSAAQALARKASLPKISRDLGKPGRYQNCCSKIVNSLSVGRCGSGAGSAARARNWVIHLCSTAVRSLLQDTLLVCSLPPRGGTAVIAATPSFQRLTPVREQHSGVGSTAFHYCGGRRVGQMGTCDRCYAQPLSTLFIT